MTDRYWPLQEAKARCSALVEAALRGHAQHVTRRGKAAVVVISDAEYTRLRQGSRAMPPSLIDHLLAMPRGSLDSEQPDISRCGPALRNLKSD